MKKTVHHKKAQSTNGRNVLIAFLILLVLLGGLFLTKHKKYGESKHMNLGSGIVGTTLLSLTPEKGCKTDEASNKYLCDIGVQNTSDETMSWAAHMTSLEGASLSNNGGGTINPQQSAVVQLSVPISFCNNNGKMGKVVFIDKSKSTNQGEAVFSCATDKKSY